MRSRSIQSLDEAWEFAPIWREFVDCSPLQSPEWLLTWWKYFGSKSKLEIVVNESQQCDVLAIAPFHSYDVYGHRQLEMLGGGHVCTDYNRVITSDNLTEYSNRAIVSFIHDYFRSQSPFFSTQLTIDGAAVAHPAIQSHCRYFEQSGFSIWRKPIESSYRIELPKSWSEYSSTISQSARRKAKKAIARIESGECTFHSTEAPEEVLVRLSQLANLHQSRRQNIGQAGSYAVKNFALFLAEAIRLLAEHRKVRIEWCEVQGQVIAMHLLLLGSKTVYMYQSGIHPDFMHLEPGHCLTVSAIRNAITKGVLRYDFLRGDEPYKTFWGGTEVPLAKLSMRPPRLMSQLVGKAYEKLWNLKQCSNRAMNAFASTLASEKT